MNKYISILLILLFSQISYSQSDSYAKLWHDVETLEIERLPKSALKALKIIETKAKAENNRLQYLKVILFQSKFALLLEEEAQLKIIKSIKAEIEGSSSPTKNVLEHVLANLYWQYYQDNRYKFYRRSKTEAKVDHTDFRTWDLETLYAEVAQHYQNSLENSLMLQQTPIEDYRALLISQKDSKLYRPTLYDFLAHQALTFYKHQERNISKPAYKFIIDDPKYLGEVQHFSSLRIESKDSSSLELRALKLYQALTRFHLKDKTPYALADVNIDRYRFIKEHASITDAEAILLQALQDESKKHSTHEVSALYDFEIAKLYYEQGRRFAPETNAESQWQNKAAVDLCDKVISKFPESKGAAHCIVLRTQIVRPSLHIKTESILPIASFGRLLLRYKSIDELNFSAYKLSEAQYEAFIKMNRKEEQAQFIKGLDLHKSWVNSLKNEGDYQEHSTEILFPKLANGRYLIVGKSTELEQNFQAHTTVQISNIASVEYEDNQKKYFQFINRNTGKPLANAKVELNYFYYNDGFATEQKTTNAHGKIAIIKPSSRHRNLKIKVWTKDDVAYFGNYYINKYYRSGSNPQKLRNNAFLFTDRSIYRPGQTVYFKGIAMQSKNEKSEVRPQLDVKVLLYNVNREKVKELKLKTNDFGSVSGEFILTSDGLTGAFYIELQADITAHARFSVEEYKRPKFKTQFEPISDSYKVNDSITVKGKAVAFAGSNISEAKVVYRVKRKVQYPRWYSWKRSPVSDSGQEIAYGETKTDADGHYDIVFKAIPDESVDKKGLPIFNYEITADVTDINGETRSTTSIVHVGYHALTANIIIDSRLDKANKEHQLRIDSKNLNGVFVGSKGEIKIYKLQAPGQVLRPRPWPAPDYHGFTKSDFAQKFPHDAYLDEDHPKNWAKGKLVYNKNFNTEVSKTLALGNIKKWTSGQYLVLLETQDKFGQLVKDETKITLFSTKETLLADNALISISTDKTEYEINDTVELTLASAASDISVTVDIEKDHKIVDSYVVHLKQNTKRLKIPVNYKDRGGFVIHYSFAAFNSYHQGTLFITVPYPKSQLEIEILSFRDKLQPGTDETWSFKIKGPQGEQVSAELLASMYDASLDAFKAHNWSFNPIYHRTYYSSFRKQASRSFGQKSFRIERHVGYLNYPNQQRYDSWNWFGLSLSSQSWTYQNYLSKIRNLRQQQAPVVGNRTTYDKIIKGIVVDEEGLPLAGVNIRIKDTNFGTQTDFDGNYSLGVKNLDRVIYSFIGYKNANLSVNKNSNFDVIMEENHEAMDEVVITALGIKRKKDQITMASQEVTVESLEGEVAGMHVSDDNAMFRDGDKVSLRGNNAISGNNQAIVVIDGKVSTTAVLNTLDPKMIISVNVLKGEQAVALYGKEAANGVILVITKNNRDTDFSQLKIRKNLQETAFFFPQLRTDKNGVVTFSFTSPEALSSWKLQVLAHTKTMNHGTTSLLTITQKELMVLPNVPRFLREGDRIKISTKIANLTAEALSGIAALQLFDALTGKAIDAQLSNTSQNQSFQVDTKGNTSVTWALDIPFGLQAIEYKIVAKSGNFSDGEQNALPVLTNRMLVTETLPMWIKSNETKTFTLDKLQNQTSTTLKHHKLSLEMTSNPAWYAVQALPYLMEFPYECNEQTFSRYYANALATHIANSNPRIQAVFEQWKNTDALLSNLEKNQELKSLLIQETPWLRDAQSETEQKKRIALLFDLNKMSSELKQAQRKLKNNQMASGAWSWFGNYRDNRYITQHIITGFGHLKQLKVDSKDDNLEMINKALKYLDAKFVEEYKNIRKYDADVDLSLDHLSYTQLHYLYMRSFFPALKPTAEVGEIMSYYRGQIKQYWGNRSLYAKGMMALIAHRNVDATTSARILKSLKENSIVSEELGMYWKSNTNSWYWYKANIETHALLIEAFSEIEKDNETIDQLKIWLLKHKQTNRWKTTKSTAAAVYALLLQGSDWLSVSEQIEVLVGGQKINPSKMDAVKVEAGTGYFKTSWSGSDIKPEMAEVQLTKKGDGIAWGSLYWQYFEDLDKITSAETPLKLKKKLFKKTNTATGEVISEIKDGSTLNVGDLVRVRIELRCDRAMEFVHMKDMRAAGLEPVNVLSKYKYQDGLGYYESTKDAATNFFFDYLPKGIYVFEYDLRVSNAGDMSNGITTIQSMYAPEFSSHSEGIRIKIGPQN